MTWDKAWFKHAYVAAGGSPNAANSYTSYLNRADSVIGGIDERLQHLGPERTLATAKGTAAGSWGDAKQRSDSLSALRWYAARRDLPPADEPAAGPDEAALRAILAEAKALGARYYAMTGKPLGVTGEVAELEAADKLDLRLAGVRTVGYDAIRLRDGRRERIQIKGRAVDAQDRYRGACPSIKCGDRFDRVLLVLLDSATLDALEILEASEADVVAALAQVSDAKRNRDVLSIRQFRRNATKVWPR